MVSRRCCRNNRSSSCPMDATTITYDKMALACDGAYGQIKAIKDVLYSYCLQKRHSILWCQYAGGCSLVQSSNDNGHSHSLLHSNFSSSKFKYHDIADPIETNWLSLQRTLKNIWIMHLTSRCGNASSTPKCFLIKLLVLPMFRVHSNPR